MKRLLAAILTLSMVFNLTPISAFAVSGKDSMQTTAVQAAQLDAALVREIASDPFLNWQTSAQPNEPETTADTSDVSMTATNSFGKLLLNGMNDTDSENGGEFSSGNRLTSVALNGRTAVVEYSAEETADLVVSIYQDSAEQEMVLSATVEVQPTVNGTAKVAIEGIVPEYYIIKAFLLDKTEHAPLCKETSNIFNTKDMVDLEEATTASFPKDRVIDLDGDPSTNFAVVNPEVTLVTADDNLPGVNQVVQEDDEGLNYTIANASEEIKNLQEGDILTYEYEPGTLLIVRVAAIDVTGDTVTIAGDDTLEITDVFEALKISEQPDNEEIQYIGEGADEGVKYLGIEDVDFSDLHETDETNKTDFDGSYNWSSDEDKPKEVTGKASKKFEFIKGEASDGFHTGSGVAPGAGDIVGAYKGTVTGTVNLSISATLKYLIADDHTYVSFAASTGMKNEITVTGQFEERIVLGTFGFRLLGAVYVGFTPQIHVKAAVTLKASVSATATFGKAYDSRTGVKDISSIPNVKVSASLSGELYFGIDLAPNAKILGGVATLELQAEIGASATVTQKLWDTGITLNQTHVHGCSTCYSIDWKAKIILSLKLRFFGKEALKPEHENPNSNSVTFEYDVGSGYYAPDYKDAGWGSCPHEKYKTLVTVDCEDSEGTEIYLTPYGGDTTKVGTINEQGYLVVYLDSGVYTMMTTIGGNVYKSAQFNVASDEIRVILRAEELNQPTPDPTPDPDPDQPEQPDPDPDAPDEGVDYELKDGVLTIYTENVMQDYESAEETPWCDFCDSIKEIILKPEVTRISTYSFSKCIYVTKVTFEGKLTEISEGAFDGCENLKDVYYNGTTEEWITIQIREKNEELEESVIHCSDDVLKGFGICGDDLVWKMNMDGTLIISGTGDMFNYEDKKNRTSPWAGEAIKVIVEPGVTSIGNWAFWGCESLKDVELPDGITVIGDDAFNFCLNLEEIELPSSVTYIGDEAFYNAGVVNFKIPDGVNAIGDYTFLNCPNLISVEIPNSVTYIGVCAFYSCEKLEYVKLPDGVTSISAETFQNCKSLKKIHLPQELEKIGNYAFKGCSSLENIVIPEKVTRIGLWAFMGCGSLQEIKFDGDIWNTDERTFEGCSSLTHIELPKNARGISEGVFRGCTGLEEITIPSSVTQIGRYAFDECSNLKDVYFGGTCAEWYKIYIEVGNDILNTLDRRATIHCTDGNIVYNDSLIDTTEKSADESKLKFGESIEEIDLETEEVIEDAIRLETSDDTNSTMPGSISNVGEIQYAEFENLTAGKDYVVIVSNSKENPLKSDNLVYINQAEAGSDGVLTISFISNEIAVYVVACCSKDVVVDSDPDKDDDSGSGKPGSLDSGSDDLTDDSSIIVAVLIGGITTVIMGIVAMFPVKVTGTVIKDDRTVLPNATIQLVRNATVVAQTTTDKNGTFTLKEVKRGDYILRVLYQDTVTGEQMVRTVEVNAPTKGLNILL